MFFSFELVVKINVFLSDIIGNDISTPTFNEFKTNENYFSLDDKVTVSQIKFKIFITPKSLSYSAYIVCTIIAAHAQETNHERKQRCIYYLEEMHK